MKSGQVTIKDIAKELSISPSTVSRALKDHPDISVATKIKVNELAKLWKYKPNTIALSLRNSKTNTIGVIIPELVHHFFSSVISGMEKVAQAAGYNIMIFQSNESYEREMENVQALLASRVDGVLVSMSKETKDVSHFSELIDRGVPLVFFDRICNGLKADNVVVDDFAGAYTAVTHLISTGCKRIAHLSAPQEMLLAANRQKGYEQALKKGGLLLDEDLIIKCDSFEDALVLVPSLLDLPNRPDAIFAVNELTAAGAIKAIKEHGLRIPEDISVVGFTDGLISKVTDPTMTTLQQHGGEIGFKAAEILIDRIKADTDDFEPITKVIKTSLVLRGSTKRKI